MGLLNSAAGKGTNCQILTTTTGGHRTLLAGTRSCREATLYRHLPTSAAITTIQVSRETLLRSRDLCIASSPRSLLHCGNDLVLSAAYKAGRTPSTSSHHHPSSFQADLDKSIGARNCGTLGTDRGGNYERAVRSILWVRVKYHFLSTARRVVIWGLAYR